MLTFQIRNLQKKVINPGILTDYDNDVWILCQRELFQDDVLQVHGRLEGWQGFHPGGNGFLHGQQGARNSTGLPLILKS